MIKLTKDSVGKVYVDGKDNRIVIVYQKRGYFVGEWVDEENHDCELDVYCENGNMRNGDRGWCNLVSEYTPPRPIEEVMEDFIKWFEENEDVVFDPNVNFTFKIDQLNLYKALLKEAKEVMKGLEL